MAIRAIKAPLAVDLTDELARDLGAKDPDWMFGGQYGVIQLAARG
jgi:DNA primase catalytic subunit